MAQNALSTKCSVQRPPSQGSSASRSKSLHPDISRASTRGLSPRWRSPTQSTLVSGSKSPCSSISRTSTSRLASSSSHTQPPFRRCSLSKAPPSHVAWSGHAPSPSPTSGHSQSCSLTPDEGDQPKHQVERASKQVNPSKLGFYPTCWQTFLQAAKLEMHLQAVLTHPIPEHRDAVGLAWEVLDAELWKYHSKKIRLDNGKSLHTTGGYRNLVSLGYFLEYHDQMSHLLCDDLFTFQTELKKVVISIAKQLYNIFPRSSVMHKDLVQKCVTEAASKLIKSSDYLRLPDSSEGRYKNFALQVLKDGCLDFYYSNGKKALKLTEEFQCSIPINGLILVAVVVKGILSGFRETDIPEHRQELKEMLEEWVEFGMMSGVRNGSDSGSAEEDVNIII
ncbi:uncharacterized protein HD556DRAFT_1446402 [Suillus plorans]|uniref:DUF6532 domain-containing protein n=1 Tax=Suillus plorans TaxID=116603 RepID=A0A9P7AK70_9AGAM|nr:uncharacterized protein HD556DRAFT_1446402 [Suillus plorans]KAG1790049.1 hypothetical protein HD556DRAFT_1446402 [Suillus plorans]